ncbi:protoporphyrinogen oxidase [Lysinibacillus contaminans]|uniref:Coproporphyrinogen III oxidase n=1 Tax=Lysinibacillus contaminans TaxID=1293441 RepID=A0ABR5K5R4_9BACI|nr:protoporphyrinogen oxidase [Lysinibacillus contaminans]KOS71635.1 protoporphyrinogen oxidase [Lysinibacillus contaminans]
MTQKRRKVVVIGGGITGLTAAFYMQKEARAKELPVDIVLVESSLRLGGKIQTQRKNGFIIERGPESFFDRQNDMYGLAKDLGIESELITSNAGPTYVAVGSRLYPIPSNLMSGETPHISPFIASGLFSLSGKIRATGDFILPRSAENDDQSLGGFFRRRFGPEVVENLVEPLLAGTFAGDIEQLSLHSTFPQLYEIEQKHRSLLVGMKKSGANFLSNEPIAKDKGIFQSFANGLETLVEKLEESLLPGTVLKGVKVEEIEHGKDNTVQIILNNFTQIKADAVVVATPFNVAQKIFSKHNLLTELKTMKAATIATVTMAFKKEQLGDLDALSFFVSRNSDFSITSCTWSNRKWPNTTPEDYVLLRSYIGRVGDEAIVELSDSEIEKTVLQDLMKTIGINGAPVETIVSRWKNAMPQYTVGHEEKIARVKQELQEQFPTVKLSGSSFEGISIPECVKQGKTVAQEILNELGM